VLAVDVVAFAYKFTVGEVRPSEDGRVAVVLTKDERNALLLEMRAWLENSQLILAAASRNDLGGVVKAASASGMAAEAETPASLFRKIPLEMKTLGFATRKKFDGMKPRITLITLGVDDLERSLRFYRDGLGLKSDGIVGKEYEHGAVAFFDLDGGLKLALWPRASIAHDTGLPAGAPSSTEFTLGHNVASRAQVDEVMEQAKRAGATVVKPAHETFWGGYAGYFQDPDRHLWEVAWNPHWVA